VPAIRDLATTLVSTDQYGAVVSSLRQQLQRRLLHAAVSTGKIITVYISVLKVCPPPPSLQAANSSSLQVLLLLDPSATTVDSVAAPIKAYLRNRKDTLRCIIEGLISDTDSDLCVPTLVRSFGRSFS
jgi:anaphase-promoting complex subunit 2